MAPRKPKHSAVSFQDYRALHERFSDDKDFQYDWKARKRVHPAQSALEAVKKATEEEPSDSSVRTNTRNKRAMRSSNYVERMALSRVVPSRPSIGSLTRDADTSIGEAWSMHAGETQCPADRISKSFRPKRFRDTGFGRLAPEIRQIIFTNLLASPPAYAGHDFRAVTALTSGQSPISLATFVDLKRSNLAILRTCRQIYFEAFPVFYANKSYYVANAQDLGTMLGHRFHLKPRLFRLNTITSLCLRYTIFNKPQWSPKDIDMLISRHASLNRESLQAQRTDKLDPGLLFVDFQEMKSLRKLCLCILAGQELEVLKFLFNIEGFGYGVIDFIDDFHWSIHSQNVSPDDWKLQYPGFCYNFYRLGDDFKLFDYENILMQKVMLTTSSRASDLREGDERWIEIDIGALSYEDTRQYQEDTMRTLKEIMQAYPDTPDSEGSESQQEISAGEADDPLPDHASDRTDNHLQELGSCQGDALQSEDELVEGSQHGQVQRNGQEDDAQTDGETAQRPSYLKVSADSRQQTKQADLSTNASKRLSTDDIEEAPIQEPRREGLIDPSRCSNIQVVHTLHVMSTKLQLRAVTLILAVSLAYVLLSETFEETISQLLTLFLAILLWFAVVAVLSEESE